MNFLVRYGTILLWLLTVVFGFGGLYAKVDNINHQLEKLELKQTNDVLSKRESDIIHADFERRLEIVESKVILKKGF